MTLICAVRTLAGTWIGSDQLISNGHTRYGFSKKWAHSKRLSIGIAGVFVATHAVQHYISKFKPDMDPFTIWKTMRSIYKTIDFKPVDKPESDEAPYYGCTFMFATADRLLMFGGDGGSVEAKLDEFYARGSGCEFATGAWTAMSRVEKMVGHSAMHPKVKLKTAIESACESDHDCGGTPYVELRTKSGLI